MLTITTHSHLDHDLTAAHLAFMLERYKGWDEFFLDTVELPKHLPPLCCGLYGPTMGDAPVLDADVVLQPRTGRAWPSRLVDRPMRTTRLLTTVAGPHEGLSCMLYTSYGGPEAPREPGDPTLVGDTLAQATAFWAQHALAR